MASASTPHKTNIGAEAIPPKLLCDPRTATSIASSALASGAGPGTLASGVRATIRPATVAMITVHEVVVSIIEVGNAVASSAAPSATNRAIPSHSRMPPASAGSVVGAVSSGYGRASARVQRLKRGANEPLDNSNSTQSE